MPWINSEHPGWGYSKARFGVMVLLLSLNTADSMGGGISVLVTRLTSTGYEAHLNDDSSSARSMHIMEQRHPFVSRPDIHILLVPHICTFVLILKPLMLCIAISHNSYRRRTRGSMYHFLVAAVCCHNDPRA